MVLSDGKALLLLVSRKQSGIVVFQNLIGSVRHGEIAPEVVTVECLVQTQLQLITFGAHLTEVGCRRSGSEVRRNGAVATRDQHVVAVVDEEVDVTGDESAQEAIVDTEVLLG